MPYNNLDIDTSMLAENIKIRNKCVYYGVEEVVISSICVNKSIRFIRKINDEPRVLLYFISTDNITRKYLCGNSVHLTD